MQPAMPPAMQPAMQPAGGPARLIGMHLSGGVVAGGVLAIRRTIAAAALALVVVGTGAGPSGDDDPAALGPQGGELLAPDGGLRLSVPPGALRQPVALAIAQADQPGCYALTPAGTTFEYPASLTTAGPVARKWVFRSLDEGPVFSRTGDSARVCVPQS